MHSDSLTKRRPLGMQGRKIVRRNNCIYNLAKYSLDLTKVKKDETKRLMCPGTRIGTLKTTDKSRIQCENLSACRYQNFTVPDTYRRFLAQQLSIFTFAELPHQLCVENLKLKISTEAH